MNDGVFGELKNVPVECKTVTQEPFMSPLSEKVH